MILQEIKQQRLHARKAGDQVRANLFGTLIGECERLSKTPINHVLSEAEVVAAIRGMLKRTRDTIDLIQADPKRAGQVETLRLEEGALEALLPAQKSADDLAGIVRPMRAANCSISEVMTKLKTEYAGSYDPRVAITVVAVFDEAVAPAP